MAYRLKPAEGANFDMDRNVVTTDPCIGWTAQQMTPFPILRIADKAEPHLRIKVRCRVQ